MSVKSTPSEKHTVLCVSNDFDENVKVIWLDYEGDEVHYATIKPGETYRQATYPTHPWRIKRDQTILYEYCGDSATLTINKDASITLCSFSSGVPPATPQQPTPHPTDPQIFGHYRQRSTVYDIPICAYDSVSDAAINQAAAILKCMLQNVDPSIINQMAFLGASLAIIGRNQVTTDIPAHAYLKGQRCDDGRCYDEGTRGLGGTLSNPVTSVGEENILMEVGDRYSSESILVHEMAHAVMEIGLVGRPERIMIADAYCRAIEDGLHDPESYLASNEDEYWAEATQAWFDATVRMDATSGMIVRRDVVRKDPRLAAVLEAVYGNGSWRYLHTASRRRFRTRRRNMRLRWCFAGC